MAEAYSLRRLDAVEAKQERLMYVQKEFPLRAGAELLFICMYHGQLAQRDLEATEKNAAFSG